MIGRVFDAAAIDAITAGNVDAQVWLETAWATSSPVLVPALAMTEVGALRPERTLELFDLLEHPAVLRVSLGQSDPRAARDVAEVLAGSRTYDVCSGHVVVLVRQRGWPVISGDPGRLERIAPDLNIVAMQRSSETPSLALRTVHTVGGGTRGSTKHREHDLYVAMLVARDD